MAHLVASITLDSARSYVMHSAFLTQGTVSSIPIVFRWSDSIRPKGFMSSVLLWLMIIVAVVGVSVTVVVVVESYFVVKLVYESLVTCTGVWVGGAVLPDPLASGYVNGFPRLEF
ncbi:hypothetical protein Tco_0659176 [Tanacetum coccineum]